ncbi:hypothetical protein QE152_g14314 [Popillia japonica]|uniref:Uncharacterized protein n=1 Tax=Popillia japonica TaxID=7064 RepID=A0AAW1L9W7_POPJA
MGLGNRNKTSWGVLAPSMTIMMMMRMTRKFEQYRIDVDGMKKKKTASASGSYDNVAALDEPRREMHRLLIGMRTVFLSPKYRDIFGTLISVLGIIITDSVTAMTDFLSYRLQHMDLISVVYPCFR